VDYPVLGFTLVALGDGRASHDVVDGKLEHDRGSRLPVLGKVDLAGDPAEGANDLVVIDAAS
jgi:hypothetical protein